MFFIYKIVCFITMSFTKHSRRIVLNEIKTISQSFVFRVFFSLLFRFTSKAEQQKMSLFWIVKNASAMCINFKLPLEHSKCNWSIPSRPITTIQRLNDSLNGIFYASNFEWNEMINELVLVLNEKISKEKIISSAQHSTAQLWLSYPGLTADYWYV